MAKNQRYSHFEHINLPVPEGTVSGDPVLVGAIAGVAKIDRQVDGTATVWLDGSYIIDVAGALTPGQRVYVAANGTLTATANDSFWGVAAVAKGTGTGPAEVAPAGIVAPAAAAAGA